MRERLSAYYLLFFMAAGSSGPFLTLLLHHRGLTASRIGLILAAGALAGTLVQPLIGHLNDIIGRPRLFLFISALASPMLFWGYAFARGFAWFILISVGCRPSSRAPFRSPTPLPLIKAVKPNPGALRMAKCGSGAL